MDGEQILLHSSIISVQKRMGIFIYGVLCNISIYYVIIFSFLHALF